MVRFKNFKNTMLLALSASILASAPVLAQPKLPKPDEVRAAIEGFAREAEAVLQKRVEDFAGCPSNDAQATYDMLIDRRNRTTEFRNAFQEVCNKFHDPATCSITTLANAKLTVIEQALARLREMRCYSGCEKKLGVIVPAITFSAPGSTPQGGPANVPGNLAARYNRARPRLTPGPVEVCTGWDRGEFEINADAGNGELSGDVRARLPKCTRSEKLYPCGSIEVAVALPILKQLKIVPPDIDPGSVKIEIPRRDVQVVSGMTPVCNVPLATVCTKLNDQVIIKFNKPLLQTLREAGESACLERENIGCVSPPFGYEPTYATVQVLDLARAKVLWTNPKLRSPGEIIVDFTRPELSGSFRPSDCPPPPGAPVMNLTWRRVQTEFCEKPKFENVVRNQH